MSDVDVTVSVPAAAKQVADALTQLVADIKAKKTATELLADVLPAAMQAVQQFSELEAEVKDPQLPVLAGLLAGQLVKALLS